MARIIAVDYGAKRCGIAETDDMQIIASALEAVPTTALMDYLERYMQRQPVEALVVGLPVRMSGELSEIETAIQAFLRKFEKKWPYIPTFRVSETFTSKMAVQAMVQAGARKKTRSDKGNIDKVSAALILQQFLELKRNKPTA
jgi:putative Holliday junction resolvase